MRPAPRGDGAGPAASAGEPLSGGHAAGTAGPLSGGSRRQAAETDRDPGLQPERTRLAWRRTTLSWAVAAVLAVRQALRANGPVPAAAVCLAALSFLAFLLLAHLRIQRLGAARPAGMPGRAALGVAGCAVVLAACGAALVWVRR